MKVSAVCFLFQNNLKNIDKSLKGKNYTCIIHKTDGEGMYTRNQTSSPIIEETTIDVVSPEDAQHDVIKTLDIISDEQSDAKFVGAAIKDGVKETEIHSLFSDKLYAVRTKDEDGKNHFRIMNKDNTKDLMETNLYLTA